MRPKRFKIIVKIKTDGKRDNIYIDADNIQDAYNKAGVTNKDSYKTVSFLNVVENFYDNGNSIKYIKI